MALLLGAMVIQGVVPGPRVITNNPDLFWGLIASMWIGNLMLVVLNLPLVGLWVRLLKIPYYVLFPLIIVFSSIGIYSIGNSAFDLYMVSLFGMFGYFMSKLEFEPAPFLLGLVLGPMLEEEFRRAMIFSHGDATTFFTHPISLVLLLIAAAALAFVSLPSILKKREVVFAEEP
jgi:putative tricarboxylic transport membrane protein